MLQLDAGSLSCAIKADGAGAVILARDWPGFTLGPLTCELRANGQDLRPVRASADKTGDDAVEIVMDFTDPDLRLTHHLSRAAQGILVMRSLLANLAHADVILNHVTMLRLDADQASRAAFGLDASQVRIYEQSAYAGRVRWLRQIARTEGAGSEPGATEIPEFTSDLCWLACDLASRHALLVGYQSSERWLGRIRVAGDPTGQVAAWSAEFDAGDLRVLAGETIALEEMVFMVGDEPLALLARYGDQVAQRNSAVVPAEIPVSWCSWYPYRLGVTEERVMANAALAADRLKPLGLSIIEVDLGWERRQLPGAFEENDLFPSGLGSLAQRLSELGLKLGAWKAPYTVSEFDPVFKEHPEWLLRGEDGKPASTGEWFWQPHGRTFALDLTHPGAQAYLREKVSSLAERGVHYFKTDFIGGITISSLRRRHDDRVVAGGGWEAARIGSEIMHQALRSRDPDALILCCGGPEMPGRGQYALLYTCMDTGNTGFVGWKHLGETYTSVAAHLFKHRRWGIIQPSCLVVGPPGTLEEARLRATATFLCGGQVDISDDLTTLPEDRWQVLCATLPPQGRAARPIDLFEPLPVATMSYEAMARGDTSDTEGSQPRETSCVWVLDVESDWDRWTLVGLYDFEGPRDTGGITSFRLTLEQLGLDPDGRYWAHEFWSQQFLGEVPTASPSIKTPALPGGYTHPGDTRCLIATRERGALDVAFFGPAVKLIVLRRQRNHPWIAATSFYQGGGTELRHVKWDAAARKLSGELLRPPGHQGRIFVCGAQQPPACVEVAGHPVMARASASGSVVIPVLTQADATPFRVRWG